MTKIDLKRRKLLRAALLGAGGIGLRSLASGLPLSFLQGRARAQSEPCPVAPQFLIMSTSQDGDPITCNVPGTYVNGVDHSTSPDMAATPISLGGVMHEAAKPWALLPQWALDRMCFFHHATMTVDHSDQPKVMRLLGNTLNDEMMTSIFAAQLAPCLETIQTEPVSLGARGGGELLSFGGRTLAGLTPMSLKAVLAPPEGPLAELVKLRDKELDAWNAEIKKGGTTEQRSFLEKYARSQAQVREISEELIGRLSSIDNNEAGNQLKAAMTLVQMKVAPVITVRLPFGGDNHDDVADGGEVFANERIAHMESMPVLAQFFADLETNGLQDSVTFGSYNVFGRSLKRDNNGRAHSFTHNVAIMVGQGVRPGVVGGIEPTDDGSDFKATDIDSVSGAPMSGGDIEYKVTMTSMAKTFGAMLGLSRTVLDEHITSGKIVEAAVIS